jgi:hypothetical protein
MSLFIEVQSVEKDCNVIVNLDEVLEIAPLREGGCSLFFSDSAAVGGKVSFKVKDSYEMFKQFCIQPVSSDDIAKKVKAMKIAQPQSDIVIPKL